MSTESINKEFKLTTQEQVDNFYEILENHKANSQNEYDFLMKWVDSYISELQNIKIKIQLEKALESVSEEDKNNININDKNNKRNKKDKIKADIHKIFGIIDCFEAQKKLYEKIKR